MRYNSILFCFIIKYDNYVLNISDNILTII